MIRINKAATCSRMGVSSPRWWYTEPVYINPDKICLIEKIPLGNNGSYSLDITLSTGEKIYSNNDFDDFAKLNGFVLVSEQVNKEESIDVLINKNMIVSVERLSGWTDIIFDVLDLSYVSRKLLMIRTQELPEELAERLG